MYKILWIDDQYNDPRLIEFAIEADNNHIYLEGYSSFEEGFEALEKNLEKYDVILLDGLFFEKKGQQMGTEDESGIGMAIARINELKSKKAFPWFVLSGKDAFTKNENSIIKANKARCFDKTNPSDVIQLFEVIKIAAKNQPNFQLKHQYRNILKICDNKYIGDNQFERVFSLIKDLENKDGIEKTGDLFNPIRKIIEALFGSLRDIGVVPSEVKSLNRSSLFLANKHNDYIHLSEFIHPMVAENLHRLINITQAGSHGEGELQLRVDEYLQNNNTDFLYKSTVYLLFDILVWFKDFIDENGNSEANKMLWEKKTTMNPTHDYNEDEWVMGNVVKISRDNWGTFEPINTSDEITLTPRMVETNELELGDYIKVITEPSPDGSKLHIKAISKDV